LKILLKSLLYVISAILLFLLLTALCTIIPVNSNYEESKEGTEIYISTNGVHTNIILPAKTDFLNWGEYLQINGSYKYFEFGWGDKEFYLNTPTWDDLEISTAIKAAFLPTKTIMQVSGYKQIPQISKKTVKIIANDVQFQKITTFVAGSFKQNGKNRTIKITPNSKYSFNEKFYQANGTYHLFNTCNNWTNKGLKQAGIKNALYATFDKSVMYHLK